MIWIFSGAVVRMIVGADPATLIFALSLVVGGIYVVCRMALR